MGNAPSSSGNRKRSKQQQQQRWNWDFKNGRAQIKPRGAAKAQRPLFVKRPSDDYDWWIFNPDSNRRRSNNRGR